MAKAASRNYQPDFVSSPGETLQETIEALGISPPKSLEPVTACGFRAFRPPSGRTTRPSLRDEPPSHRRICSGIPTVALRPIRCTSCRLKEGDPLQDRHQVSPPVGPGGTVDLVPDDAPGRAGHPRATPSPRSSGRQTRPPGRCRPFRPGRSPDGPRRPSPQPAKIERKLRASSSE